MQIYKSIFSAAPRPINCASQAGFGLFDLAILMSVAGILLATYLSASSGLQESKNSSLVTTVNMQTIISAIDEFFLINQRLPCPANISQKQGVSYNLNGVAFSSDSEQLDFTLGSSCLANSGAVPTSKLGLPIELQLDGWSRRFYYIVANSLCNSAVCSATSFKNNQANLIVNNLAGTLLANNAAYILFSCGLDGAGCYLASGQRYHYPPNDTNELININSTGTFIQNSSTATFNHLLLFQTKLQLQNLIYDPALPIGSTDICNANNNLFSYITRDIATGSGGLDSQVDYLNASGDEAIIALLWSVQEACFLIYNNGILSPNQKQCPGGGSYISYDNSCLCNKGTWNNDC